MDREYMDRLMQDIQQYLRDEATKKQVTKHASAPAPENAAIASLKTPLPKAIHMELMLLISACATGFLTLGILLLGLYGAKSEAVVGIMTLLSIGGCGIFFTAVLVSIWKRLIVLRQIEENTRLILVTKLEANAMLERLMHK